MTPEGNTRTPYELLTHERLLAWDIRPRDKAIVIGGYDGATCEFILERFPEVELYTFEPQPAFYQNLLAKFNHLPNVHVFNHGLGNRDGIFPMVRAGTYFCSFLTGEYAQLGYAEPDSEGEMREFEAVVRELGIKELAWFHSNIEQYEYILFPHMASLGWLAKLGQVVVATHGMPKPHPEAKSWEEICAAFAPSHSQIWEARGWRAFSRPDRYVRNVPVELRTQEIPVEEKEFEWLGF